MLQVDEHKPVCLVDAVARLDLVFNDLKVNLPGINVVVNDWQNIKASLNNQGKLIEKLSSLEPSLN